MKTKLIEDLHRIVTNPDLSHSQFGQKEHGFKKNVRA